jgi:predicted N-acyltransferase
MQTLKVTVSDGFEESLRETASVAGYEDPGAYLEALVRADRKRLAQERLAAEIRKGLDSGPGKAMTNEDWERVREESDRRVREYRAANKSQ